MDEIVETTSEAPETVPAEPVIETPVVETSPVVEEVDTEALRSADEVLSEVASEVIPQTETPSSVTITEIVDDRHSKSFLASLLPKLKEKLFFRTEKRLQKILELARAKSSKGQSIRNDDVEKLLHVSDATASRYLKKLVETGRLQKTGPTRHETYSPL